MTDGTQSGSAQPGEITRLLLELRRGNRAAEADLIPLVYEELRSVASHYMGKERPGHTLQPTALVHEAYLRLMGGAQAEWQDRAHFFAVAGQVMRRILVDYARTHNAGKRGGGAFGLPFNDSLALGGTGTIDIVEIDLALDRLEKWDRRQCRIVELRYFAGLSVDETAEVLGISTRTVKRDWNFARAWLYRELQRGGSNGPQPLGTD
jgi:RNA polymerase sigma-70 factor, ECF subfamily